MILTNLHNVCDANRIVEYNSGNTYLVLGGLNAWGPDSNPSFPSSSDTNPPSPLPTQLTIPDAFAAVPAVLNWVYQNDAGIYSILSSDNTVVNFSILETESDLFAYDGDVYVMLSATLLDADISDSIAFYRQIGFATNLVPTSPYSYASPYIPAAHVTSWGYLETLEYRRPYPVLVGSQHDFYEIIQY